MSSSLVNSSIALNKVQNNPNFELPDLEEQMPIFKEKLCSKTLNPFKENPEDLKNYRTVTIKCLYKGCS